MLISYSSYTQMGWLWRKSDSCLNPRSFVCFLGAFSCGYLTSLSLSLLICSKRTPPPGRLWEWNPRALSRGLAQQHSVPKSYYDHAIPSFTKSFVKTMLKSKENRALSYLTEKIKVIRREWLIRFWVIHVNFESRGETLPWKLNVWPFCVWIQAL